MTEEWKNKLIELYTETEENTKERSVMEYTLGKLKLGYFSHRKVCVDGIEGLVWKIEFHLGDKPKLTDIDRAVEADYVRDTVADYESKVLSDYNAIYKW